MLFIATLILVIPLATAQAQDQCNKTVGIYEEINSPTLTPENIGKPILCHYRFRPFRTANLRDWVLRIRFSSFKVGRLLNSTHCEGGYFQIVDGSASGKKPGHFCGEIESPTTFISETSQVKLIFYTQNLTSQTYFKFDSRAEQQFEVYLRYGQHPELFPNRRGELVPGTYCERVFRDCRMQTCYVQSPGYPGIYPRNLHCKYSINTRLPFIKLHLENEEFSVGGVTCGNLIECPVKSISNDCPGDHMKVYDGKDERATLIGVFCGVGKFPVSLIGTGSDLFVEFISTSSGPLSSNTGFHYNVGHWPGHVETSGKSNGSCDWIFTSEALAKSGDKQGLFWSVSHWYPPGTKCSYLMQGSPTEIVRLLFPSFRIDKVTSGIKPYPSDCAESLTIYDSSTADDTKIIKTFCDTSKPLEKYDFISTSNHLFVQFESKTGSYSGSSLYYWSTYDFFNDTRYGDRILGTSCDEVFTPWRSASGPFGSPLNTLVYKGDSVVCTYYFETVKRLYSRVLITIQSTNFKYNQDNCINCISDRVDKLTIHNGNSTLCICKDSQALPLKTISHGPQAKVVFSVDPRHAVSNYFKSPIHVFSGKFQFVHPPICGGTRFGPVAGGKLRFPYYYNPAEREKPVYCLWELNVKPGKDLWINLEKLVFSLDSKTCQDARLELFLPGTKVDSPLLTLCGDSNVGDRKTEISSQLPIIPGEKLSRGLVVRLEASSGSKLNFVISWTELSRLGDAKTERREACHGFLCNAGVCIDNELVCNGVMNCPSDESDESNCRAGNEENTFVVLNYRFNFNWVSASVFGGLAALIFSLFCVLCVCCFCSGRKNTDNNEEDFLT